MERSFFALALAYLLIAALSLRDTRAARTPMARRVLAVTAVVTTAGLLAFPFGLMAHTYFPRVAEPYTSQGEQVVAVHEGTSETILFMQNSWMGHPSYHRLVTNGFPMTATLLPAKRYMRYFAYWPLLFHRAPLRSALVICYGMGVTAGAVTEIDSLESIDVVDVSRDMVSMSDRVYPPDQHPLHDRRSHLHFEDGRYFLQTTGQRFDLITGEPPPPRTPGTVNLYTREYFQLLHDRLNEGGTTTYWLPVARPPFEEVQVASIIRAFCDVFEDCSLWNGTPADWILVGTRHASGQVSAAQMEAPWTHARVNASLREIGFEVPEQLAATFLADAHDLRALTAHSLPLTDDYPRRLDSADAGRPALDPYGENPQALYRTLRDIDRARRAFEDSDFIRTLLPSTLLHDTAPYFAVQRVIDRVLADGPNILSQAGDLQWLLTRTTLRSPPFWILGQGNHPLTSERLASLHDDGSGSIEYVRGLALLVDRDYAGAVSLLSHSLQRGLVDGAPALVVALCLSGRCDLAQELRPHGPVHDADEAAFWGWVDAASLRGRQTGAGGDDSPEFR
jgi:spermidine synthase